MVRQEENWYLERWCLQARLWEGVVGGNPSCMGTLLRTDIQPEFSPVDQDSSDMDSVSNKETS